MADTDDWPSLGQELGRKTSEVIHKWMTAYEAGKISLKEFWLIVTSVYDSTSGLAPRDISAMLANIEKELRDEAAARRAAKDRL